MTLGQFALKVPLILIFIASLPSKAYDKFNEYIYKVSFVINRLSKLFEICLPNDTDENRLTITNPFSDQ